MEVSEQKRRPFHDEYDDDLDDFEQALMEYGIKEEINAIEQKQVAAKASGDTTKT